MTDRRLKGVLLLAVVLFVAILMPGLHAKEIRGTALIGQVPGAPRLGECLLQTPPAADVVADPGTSYRLGSCAGPHFGEVAEVIADSRPHSRASNQFSDPNALCVQENEYLGWSSPIRSSSGVQWLPIDTGIVRMNPTSMQRKFGQNWVVCVLTPLTSGATYTGSVRDSLATGRLPSVFGNCASSDSPTSTLPLVRCDQPHPFELFGSARLPPGFRDQKALDAQCADVVRSATHTTDPTVDGQLTIRAVVSHQDANYRIVPGFGRTETAGSPDPTVATCIVGVAGRRLLTATLFGLGAAPLPWA